ncbi:hypothetical protein ABC347_05420 [Sphingomonas sp. 1P06PA]|uniref:hypothetical protein n=1 Tax=Sphingomonas sp. 1P06PA TaxID=554121 RepID=UPI0039A52C45
MTSVALPRAAAAPLAISMRAVAGTAFGLLALPHLLLGSFLGFSAPVLGLSAIAIAVLGVLFARGFSGAIPAHTAIACLAIATGLCLLGGEGRIFHANLDWQVRDAVLRDLVVYPWPFAYAGADRLILRLPSAMYLLPALIGKASGVGTAQVALLACNSVLLGSLFALGAALFEGSRERRIAISLLVAFSGLDALGKLLMAQPVSDHIEWWSSQQYSSMLTLLFWVPQHAIAGWTAALLYLLWRAGRIGLPVLLVPMPLLALWSPLALAGAMPFLAHAGMARLLDRGLRPADLLPALAALAVAIPSLLYLATGSGGAVGGGERPMRWPEHLLFVSIEVVPYLLAIARTRETMRFGGATLAITGATLLLLPLASRSGDINLVMRLSIAPLAILAVQTADLLIRSKTSSNNRLWATVVAIALMIGAVTPALEIARAIRLPVNPIRPCSYLAVVPGGAPTYVAPLARLPSPIRPVGAAIARPEDRPACRETILQRR